MAHRIPHRKHPRPKPGGTLLARAVRTTATNRNNLVTPYYVTACQPNSTLYINNHQDVPYSAATKLAQYLERQWSGMMPPLLRSNFTQQDAERRYTPRSAAEIFKAVVDIRGHALPGNKEPGDGSRLTYIHNIIGAMFVTGKLTGDQVTLLQQEFNVENRKAARVGFNARALEYEVPIAMFIGGMKLPVEGMGNFEGFCFKTPLKP